MKNSRFQAAKGKTIVLLAAALLIGVAGCSRGPSAPTVTVGSKEFTEQLILAEIMAQMLEAHTDLRIVRKTNLGGTMICHRALTQGDLDLYAEYTGTALTAILKEPVITDPDRAYRVVSEAYRKKFACTWLGPFGFNNTYTLTVRSAFAKEKGLKRVSDLAPLAADLAAGFTAEFAVREDGYLGVKKAYGFGFGSTRDMDPGLLYKAVAQKDVDVICAFATDGRIAAYDLAVLEDDKRFFPPYYAAPVIRTELVEKHPEIGKTLKRLGGVIDDATMQSLNYEVDKKKRDPADVARDFLLSRKLIPAAKAK
jgi:glycine betaine/choline ABC-type transport system substrate-binding protein